MVNILNYYKQSTLAACRADNFYRPADYDPKNRVKKKYNKKLYINIK